MPTLVDILKYTLVLDDSQFKATAAQADAQVNQLAGSIGGKLTTAVGLLAGAFTALKIGDFLKDATLTAARTEVLGTALSVVGKNAGVSQGELALLEEQVKALGITTQEARTSIIRFIQSGLPLSKIAELARLAQDSAVTAGINSSEAFERLTRGIQTGQIELLRTAGVFVSIESELNKFAKSTGKAREGLSDIERQTVILNAVLAQGSKLAGNYEAAMGDVGKQLTSLPRFIEELKNAIGDRLLPVLETSVIGLTDFLKASRELLTDDLILKAERFFKAGSEEAERLRLTNELTEKKIELEQKLRGLLLEASLQDAANTKSFASGMQAILDIFTGKGSDDIATGGAIGKGLLAIQSYDISRTSKQLEDIERQLEGVREKAKDTFIGPIDQRAQIAAVQADAEADRIAKKAEERAKRTAERIAELAKTPTIGGDIAEGFDKQLDKVEKRLAAGMTLVANLTVDIPKLEIQQAQQQINEIFKSNAPDQGAMFDILGIQDLVEQNNQAAEQMQSDLVDAFYEVGSVAGAVFRGIGGQAGQVADSLFNAVANFSTGNLAGGFAGVIDSIFSVFGGGSDKIVASQRDLINAIEDWKQTVIDLSDLERAAQEQAVQAAQAAIAAGERAGQPAIFTEQTVRKLLESAGINAPADATLNQLKEILDALESTLADTSKSFESVIAAQTQAQRQALVRGTTGADEALRIIGLLTDIFDLNLQDQQQLLQDAFDDLIARGLLSDRDKSEFFSRIEGIADNIADATSTEPTQTERSIARVSERQADSLISGIATMDLHLREGFQAVVDALTGFAANALDHLGNATIGTQINIGSVSLEGADAAAVETIIVKNLNNANRAAGNARLS